MRAREAHRSLCPEGWLGAIMARMARLVVPGYPHHLTQRGSRRQRTFFSANDFRYYVALIREARDSAGLDIWAWCLMPNHVHFVAVPQHSDSLAALFKEAHRRYSRYVNQREGWTGHLWQERFRSCVMDEPHLLCAVRYVELNPVRAGLCRHPEDWPWSSVRAHLDGVSDGLVCVEPMRKRISDWTSYLADSNHDRLVHGVRRHSQSGRPAGDAEFVARLEQISGRRLTRDKGKP
jgi:putative transposase